MSSRERDSRSMSHDFLEDTDDESHHPDGRDDGKEGSNSTSAPGKPGRKKNPNSAAARRDQNRIAQREFRLRKQQRIRDLEARVEILSGSKDETYAELRNVVRDLMQENVHLRGLIRSLADYIGQGVGGILPSLGFDRPQEFIDFINKAETDTAFEGFQRRKKAAQATATASAAAGVNLNVNKKRTLDEDDLARKRMKGLDERDTITGNGVSKDHTTDNSRYPPLLVPISPAAPTTAAAASYYSPVGQSSQDAGVFSELLQGQASNSTNLYMAGGTPDSNQYVSPSTVSNNPQFAPAYHPPINVQSALSSQTYLPNHSAGMSPPGTSPGPAASSTTSTPAEQRDDQNDAIDDPKLQEATKLIHYHLDNYKRNNAYCLPQSLRPTLVQRTVPHESIIDGIPHPELRDRMILLRGRFDLVDCLHEYVKTLTLHGDDVLAHSNWEIGENWLRRYGFLVDQPVLSICNRWRRERGEPELTLSDIARNPQSDLPVPS